LLSSPAKLSLGRRRWTVLLAAICFYQLAALGHKRGFSAPILFHSFSPTAAMRESLPPLAVEICHLARERSLSVFSLSASLSTDPLIVQRTAEFCYPIRTLGFATFVIAKPEDPGYALCEKAAEARNILFYHCPEQSH
jgi:hypothetical protein